MVLSICRRKSSFVKRVWSLEYGALYGTSARRLLVNLKRSTTLASTGLRGTSLRNLEGLCAERKCELPIEIELVVDNDSLAL
jgi:hypothetical protein